MKITQSNITRFQAELEKAELERITIKQGEEVNTSYDISS